MIDEYISGKIVLDTSNNKFVFPALNVSNNFATIEYDAHINTKIDYTIIHVFRSMTVQELNTLHTICELERNQLLTILAMSVQNPQLAGFLLTGNRSNFLYVEGSTAWLYDCPHFLSPLYKADIVLRIGPYKILDRLSDVTYALLAQDGSTVHVHRNHSIPYYPKEPLLYPHLRSFMHFSDTTQFPIPQPTKYANSDSSPFNSDESLSEEDSQTFVTPSSFSTSNQNTPSITSNDNSLTPSTNDNSLYRHIINTPHTISSSDRSRHSSNNQTTSLPPLIDRTTKTTYKLRQQPKLDYRLFITPSQL